MLKVTWESSHMWLAVDWIIFETSACLVLEPDILRQGGEKEAWV